MNRILRGAVVLAASALFAGCNTEPDETQGGDAARIVVSPAVVFVDLADSNAVLVRLVDQQGTALNSPLTVSEVTGGISVSADSMFRPTFNPDGTLGVETRNTELRLFVRGNSLAAGSFRISGGGIDTLVQAYVTPTETAPTVSNAAPALGEPVVITLEPGLTFGQHLDIVDASGNSIAVAIDRAADGTSGTFIFVPGAPSDFRLVDVAPAYNTDLSLTVPSSVQVTAGTTGSGLPGTDAFATAPTLRPLTLSGASGVIDEGLTYPTPSGGAGGIGAKFYKFIVEETGVYDFTLDWGTTADLGLYIYDENGVIIDVIADALGGGAAGHPEHGDEIELQAGTYFLGVVKYGANPAPPYFRIDVHAH